MSRHDRVLGALLGVAVGDAAGLPFEGLSMRRVARRFERADRYRLAGRTGFVSDDTEQTALLGQALALAGPDDSECLRRFRRSMVGWLARLPFGIGGATLRSCVRMMLGLARPGAHSAGNGASMRAGILGVHLAHDPERRRRLGRSLASLTHTDERAVQAAMYVAEVSALCALEDSPNANPATLLSRARAVVEETELGAAIDQGLALADDDAPFPEVVRSLGNTGFVIHSMGICTYCFARCGEEPITAIEAAIRAGGDTDTHAAIVGGWTGALHGAEALPPALVGRLQAGPFGASHLRGLAEALATETPPPRWSRIHALLRNLALYPVVLAHGFARLAP
ncbi:MAG TPA: ADP-ribosylglycohydrolase family protein [Polyangiaceae bacterium LLY-WYZ-15_(1-7)]|nr:hypothetical protein [Myxococcales bacterium]MAT28374.1 hypothetical protein [Sandaracinus sp.]HJK91535.1 ADP-ribosylglycohydrolase family protein [Polyangiaceae bacterium LLY-WYZ-15_(1-7)]HJL04071.1 ADP-ribosylglycohydrolase family protein [Polyangiaceae bacterium LLY-WYZ-15_(1-7)]HJL08304.1 ADP-ribosylglycohydrolase family protein [Polyangiaceae bacterium LLY-WYZ-15_(1-7)]